MMEGNTLERSHPTTRASRALAPQAPVNARRPDQTDGERLALLTSTFGPIYRVSNRIVMSHLQGERAGTPEQQAAQNALPGRGRDQRGAELASLLDESRQLQAGVAANVVEAGPGPILSQHRQSAAPNSAVSSRPAPQRESQPQLHASLVRSNDRPAADGRSVVPRGGWVHRDHRTKPLDLEDPEEALAWGVEPSSELHGRALAGLIAAVQEVRADQALLAPEDCLQRRLGDPSPLDDPVDANGVQALRVEHLVAGRQWSLAGRARPL